MTAVLRGIGVATPRFDLEQGRAAEIAAGLMRLTERRGRSLATLYAQTGVLTRQTVIAEDGRSVFFPEIPGPDASALQSEPGDGPTTGERVLRYREAAPALAEEASRDCLDRAGVGGAQVTHLVMVSCTGFHAPGVDIGLIASLGLRRTVQRTMIGYMGCHGAINGLRVASAIASSEPGAVVLLCCVEICSIHFQYRPVDGAVTANALFGDGAAACVITAAGDGPRLTAFGANIFDDSQDEMGWRIGDHGFVMSLSARVPTLLRDHVSGWVDGWLADRGLSREAIPSWAIHPGGPRIVESVRQALDLDDAAVADALAVLHAHGNMSSPTILFILRRMLDRGAALPLVALAFGPGLAGEAVMIEA
jgi:predicted naringenin-chalcone synthase